MTSAGAVRAAASAALTAFDTSAQVRLAVAVSGGGDSMGLLCALTEASDALPVTIHAVTVDHGLRPEAGQEAAAVAAFCQDRGIAHATLHWRWDHAGNLQDAARRGRYQAIAQWATEHSMDAVALGHTRDDVAETFLIRLGREAGLDGLARMAADFERDGARWLRPFLDTPREDIRTYLTEQGVTWCEDASNEDARFARVRARKALEALAPLGIEASGLSATSRQLAEAASALGHQTATLAEECLTFSVGDMSIDVEGLASGHPDIQRRLLAAALRYYTASEYPPRRAPLTKALEAIRRGERMTLAGCLITPEGAKARICREWQALEGTDALPGAAWDARWTLEAPKPGPQTNEGLCVRALGEDGLAAATKWRASGLPRSSVLASPAVWKGPDCLAAPLAGMPNGWTARPLQDLRHFLASLKTR